MARDPSSRDAVVERVMARSHMAGTRDQAPLNQWGGGGGYFYEITDEGIKVTGEAMGGKEVVLSWEDRDPKNLQMIDAILLERGGQDSVLGATYEGPKENPEDPSPDLSNANELARAPGSSESLEMERGLANKNASVVPTVRSQVSAEPGEEPGTSEQPLPEEPGTSEQMAGGKYDPMLGLPRDSQSVYGTLGERPGGYTNRLISAASSSEPGTSEQPEEDMYGESATDDRAPYDDAPQSDRPMSLQDRRMAAVQRAWDAEKAKREAEYL